MPQYTQNSLDAIASGNSSKLNTLQINAEKKLSRLQPTYAENPGQVNHLSAEDLQHKLGYDVAEQLYTREDGSKFQYKFNPDGTYAHDSDGNWVEEDYNNLNKYGSIDSRNLYIDDTAEGNYKMGLARNDVNPQYISPWTGKPITPAEARYLNKKGIAGVYLGSGGNYDGTPGDKGVTPENGFLMDIELPSATAEDIESTTHNNIGQLANRAMGQGPKTTQTQTDFGSGQTEYTTPNAPMWNVDYDVSKAEVAPDTTLPAPAFDEKAFYEQELAKLRSDNSGLGNAVKAFAYTLGEGIANTVDLVPEIAEYAYGNIVGDKKWSDTKGMYDEKDSKTFKEWLGYNEEVINQLGQEAVTSVKNAWEKGDYWGLVKTMGKGLTTPELVASSIGYVAGMMLPGSLAKTAITVTSGVNKSAKAIMAADSTITKAQALTKAEEGASTGYKLLKTMAGQSGYVAEAEQFSRDAEVLYAETYNEEMSTTQKLLIRPLGMVFAKMDAMTAKAIVLGKDPIAKMLPDMIKGLPEATRNTFIAKLAATAGAPVSKVITSFGLEATTESIQTGMEKVAGMYKSGDMGVADVLDKAKYEIGGAGVLGGVGGNQMAAPAVVAGSFKSSQEVLEAIDRIKTERAQVSAKKTNVDAMASMENTYGEAGVGTAANKVVSGEEVTPEDLQVQANEKDAVEKELEFYKDTEVKTPEMIKAEVKNDEEFVSSMEKAKQDIVQTVFEVDESGNIVGIKANVVNEYINEPEKAQAKVDRVNEWMDMYQAAYTKDGKVVSDVVAKEVVAMRQKAADIARQVSDMELDKKAKETTIVNNIAKDVSASMKGKEATTGTKVEDVEKSAYELTKELVGDTLDEDTVVEISKAAAKNYEISGMVGVDAEVDYETIQEQARHMAKLKTNVEQKGTETKGYAVDIGSVTDEDLAGILTEGEVDETLTGVDNTKTRERILRKFDPTMKNNLSQVARDIGRKIDAGIAKLDGKDVGKVLKGDNTDGNLKRLALITMNAVNAAAISDTEQRNLIKEDGSMMHKDEYYAGMTNVITQIGKDYATSYGLKLKGSDLEILKAYRNIGMLGIKLAKEADLVETTGTNEMWSLVGENTYGTDNMQLAGSKSRSFRSKQVTNVHTGDKAVAYADTGVKLKDAGSRIDVNEVDGDTKGYDSEYGNTAKRIVKLLIPNANRVPNTDKITGTIKVDPNISVSEDTINAVKALQDKPQTLKTGVLGGVVDHLMEMNKAYGNMNAATSKVKELGRFLGLKANNSKLQSVSVEGSNMSKLDNITGILDNIDTLKKKVYYEYQIDSNNRITLRATVANFQGDKVYARNLMTAGEYEITNDAEREVFIASLLDELATKEDMNNMTEAEIIAKYSGLYSDIMKMSTKDGEVDYKNLIRVMSSAMEPGGVLGRFSDKGGIKVLSMLQAANDVHEAGVTGTIKTEYMPEKDASASGVFNTLMNLAGRDPERFKEVLRGLGVSFGEDGEIVGGQDAYKRLEVVIRKVIEDVSTSDSKIPHPDNKGVEALVKVQAALGNDAKVLRDLAKYPIMTWFYSAEEKTITRDLTAKMVDMLVSRAVDGDKNALVYMAQVLGKDSISAEEVGNIRPGSKEHTALKDELNKIGELYYSRLDEAFPEVSNYKEEMSGYFNTLIKNSTVDGKDYWGGKLRTAIGAIKGTDEFMSLYKSKNVAVDIESADKINSGLSNDEEGMELLTVSSLRPNLSSLMPLTAHSIDAAQLILGSIGITGTSGVMTVHDAVYGRPTDLIAFQGAAEGIVVDAAVLYDTVEEMALAMENTANAMDKDKNKYKGAELKTLTSNASTLRKKAAEIRKLNGPRLEAKQKLLSEAKTSLFGEEGYTPKTREVAVEVVPEVETRVDFLEKMADTIMEADIDGVRAETVINHMDKMVVVDDKVKSELVKGAFGKVKRELQARLADGYPFVYRGKIYIGDKTQNMVDAVEGEAMTGDMLLDTMMHEIEHTMIDGYVNEQASSKNPDVEYSTIVKILERAKGKDIGNLSPRAKARLRYVMSFAEGDMSKAVKELLAVSKEEMVVDEVFSGINEMAGLTKGRLDGIVGRIWNKIRSMMAGKTIGELLQETDNASLAIAVTSIQNKKAEAKLDTDTIQETDNNGLSNMNIC